MLKKYNFLLDEVCNWWYSEILIHADDIQITNHIVQHPTKNRKEVELNQVPTHNFLSNIIQDTHLNSDPIQQVT